MCVCGYIETKKLREKKAAKSTHKKRNFICWSALKMQMSH